MAALIRGCLNFEINKEDKPRIINDLFKPKVMTSEDEFLKAWGQTKYFLEVVNQVEFKS